MLIVSMSARYVRMQVVPTVGVEGDDGERKLRAQLPHFRHLLDAQGAGKAAFQRLWGRAGARASKADPDADPDPSSGDLDSDSASRAAAPVELADSRGGSAVEGGAARGGQAAGPGVGQSEGEVGAWPDALPAGSDCGEAAADPGCGARSAGGRRSVGGGTGAAAAGPNPAAGLTSGLSDGADMDCRAAAAEAAAYADDEAVSISSDDNPAPDVGPRSKAPAMGEPGGSSSSPGHDLRVKGSLEMELKAAGSGRSGGGGAGGSAADVGSGNCALAQLRVRASACQARIIASAKGMHCSRPVWASAAVSSPRKGLGRVLLLP